MARRVNAAGLRLIKDFEGFRADAYLCPADVWTIGYGHTRSAKPGMRITEAEAERLLRGDLADAEQCITRAIITPLTDNQFAALVSWAFNVGCGAVNRSTLRAKLNEGNYDAVPAELARWNKARGQVLRGLVRRREAEIALWLTPAEPDMTDDLLKRHRTQAPQPERPERPGRVAPSEATFWQTLWSVLNKLWSR